MASAQVLKAKPRPLKNSGYLQGLKKSGGVPGVIYGRGKENQNIVLERKELTKVFNRIGIWGIFSVEVEGQPAYMTQVKEVQKNHISGEIIHVDFLSVAMDEKINSMVRIHLAGEEELYKNCGGILQILLRELSISSLPADLPEMVEFDVSGLEIGSKISVDDLQIPGNVEILDELDAPVAQVIVPARAEEEEEEETEATETDTEAETETETEA